MKTETTYWYIHNLKSIPEIITTNPCQLTIATENDLPLFAQIRPMSDFKIHQFLTRLNHGDHCFFAWLDEQLVHYSWVQTRGIHSIIPAGMKREISPGEFWIYDCRTAEPARGQRVYPFVLVSLLQQFLQQGFCNAHIYTTQNNLISQKGILRAGFQLYKTIKAISLSGRVWTLSIK